MNNQNINTNQEYKYGFTTDIENIRAPKGLNENSIKFISKIKKEPKWMLDWRLKAFNLQSNIHFGSFFILDINFIEFSFKPFGARIFSISVVNPYLYS